MGCSIFKSHAGTSDKNPNPNPKRFEVLEIKQYTGISQSFVMKVRYLDCTNYEGIKIMVYRGVHFPVTRLDPHFSEDAMSPFARFEPTQKGWDMANVMASFLSAGI
jgi:hypothetical protein